MSERAHVFEMLLKLVYAHKQTSQYTSNVYPMQYLPKHMTHWNYLGNVNQKKTKNLHKWRAFMTQTAMALAMWPVE